MIRLTKFLLTLFRLRRVTRSKERIAWEKRQ